MLYRERSQRPFGWTIWLKKTSYVCRLIDVKLLKHFFVKPTYHEVCFPRLVYKIVTLEGFCHSAHLLFSQFESASAYELFGRREHFCQNVMDENFRTSPQTPEKYIITFRGKKPDNSIFSDG